MNKIALIALACMSLACVMSSAAVKVAPTAGIASGKVQERPRIVAKIASGKEQERPRNDMICGTWNVRGQAGGAGPSKRWLRDGDAVTVYETVNGWARIGNGEWVNLKAVCHG